MNSGVYAIVCRANNKFYIGSSVNLSKRINQHKKALENKRHKNPHLQNAYNLFGKNEFYYLIIDYCLDTLEKEQYWITSTFCYDRKIGFNNTKKANAPLGYKHTSESRKIMSDIKKQQYKEGKIASNFKFRTVTKHSEETKEKIRQTKLGEKNPMYGKKLSQKEKEDKSRAMNSVPRWNAGKTSKDDPRLLKLATWKGKLPPNAKKCRLINELENVDIQANSLKELSEKSKIPQIAISRILKNKSKKYKNYKIIYESTTFIPLGK